MIFIAEYGRIYFLRIITRVMFCFSSNYLLISIFATVLDPMAFSLAQTSRKRRHKKNPNEEILTRKALTRKILKH